MWHKLSTEMGLYRLRNMKTKVNIDDGFILVKLPTRTVWSQHFGPGL